ncbi:diguanylate cyclase domain-containing protein [Chitinimonas taiwanensis]|uniref:diguanylate cyclase domain-containing protein n=1 Tax=Chitinimonas taiwanensis TaxID=240412 RepID=UPI0035AFCA1E
MPHEIVHTIGSTAYFVLFILFLWVSRIPRTNPGAGWWAAAMLFAFSARLVFLLLLPQHGSPLTVTLYATLNVIEKLCLLTGLVRFFSFPLRLHGLWLATLAVELWLLLAWAYAFAPMLRGAGVALFNAACLAYVAWIAYQKRAELQPWLMRLTAISSALLALHWLTVFVLIEFIPGWFTQGFLLGTLLALIQYFSLLAALLLSFQQRLLDAEAKALDMAFQDPLTGLNNQRYMSTLFDKVLLLANRPHQLVAVIYIDLDNFKPINDSAGHAVGDQVLKAVAARLKQVTRSTDICARVGGDEFVAICTQLAHQQQAHEIASKLLAQLTSPITVAGKDYVLGASIGISLYPLHGDSLPRLLEYADSAMYEIKRAGKNGYRIHASASDARPPGTA